MRCVWIVGSGLNAKQRVFPIPGIYRYSWGCPKPFLESCGINLRLPLSLWSMGSLGSSQLVGRALLPGGGPAEMAMVRVNDVVRL